MSLDNTNVVDAIGIERETGSAVLSLFDAWDWTDEYEHLIALQAKLNAYFNFIESGQIYDDYPGARCKQLIIDVITRFPLAKRGEEFLAKATEVAFELQVAIRHKYYPDTVATDEM